MTADTPPTDEPPTDEPPTDEPPTDERTDRSNRRRSASDADNTTASALADHAIPLDTVDPMANLDDLAPLHDALAESRIVGLGEATHGSREFFQLKHRLLRYLVTELDVRVFGLEANFAETLAIDEYVVSGAGDPIDALEGTYLWPWRVESVLEMVEWLRDFNASRPVDDRVRFYGFDAQYSQGGVEAIVELLETVGGDFLRTIRDDLDVVADGGASPIHDDELAARVEAADRVLPALRDFLRENRDAIVEATSKPVGQLARQHLRTLEQCTEYKRAVHARLEGAGEEDDAVERCLRVRDRAMADTVDWILAFEEADRMAIWAHDMHVNRVANTSRRTGVTAPSLGGHLAARHGDEYYTIGFSFGRGSFQAVSESTTGDAGRTYRLREQTVEAPVPDSFDATLAELGYPLTIVDIREASEDDGVATWLSAPQRHRSVGAVYDPGNPEEYVTEYVFADAFDATCYVDETTRARPVERTDST